MVDWEQTLAVALAERCVDAVCRRPRSRHSREQAWRCWQRSVARSEVRPIPLPPLQARSGRYTPKGQGRHLQAVVFGAPPDVLWWLQAGKLALGVSQQEVARRALTLAMGEVEEYGWQALVNAEDILEAEERHA